MFINKTNPTKLNRHITLSIYVLNQTCQTNLEMNQNPQLVDMNTWCTIPLSSDTYTSQQVFGLTFEWDSNTHISHVSISDI